MTTKIIEGKAGENIEAACKRVADVASSSNHRVTLVFNDTEIAVYPTVWETAAASYFAQRRPK
jgi:hypothetical protein